MTHSVIFLDFLFLHSVATVCSSVTVSLSTLSIASYCEDSSLVSLDLIPFSWSVCVLVPATGAGVAERSLRVEVRVTFGYERPMKI